MAVQVRARHDTYLNVEPITGITMQVAKRLQLSIRLVPITAFLPNASNPSQPIPLPPWGQSAPCRVLALVSAVC